MKSFLTGLLLALPIFATAKPVVLISYYTPYDNAPFNNSGKVALELARTMVNESRFDIKLCEIPTAYDRAYAAVERCQRQLREPPIMYLGLGEYGCDMKFETMGRNQDKNLKIPDLDGNLRNAPIISEGPKVIGLNLPAADMYCSLQPEARQKLLISNNAGTFVCNNTAYQYAYYYPEVSAGFIHVPSHFCKELETKNKDVVANLSSMLRTAVSSVLKSVPMRQPLTKAELGPLRNSQINSCRTEFYKRSKSADEKSFWQMFN